MQLRGVLVVVGLALISQGATCHPPIVPVAAYMPVAPAMRPAGSVSVSAVGGAGLGALGPRFEEDSTLYGVLFGGVGRVELQPLDGVAFALSGGAMGPLGGPPGDPTFRGAAHGSIEARFRVAGQHAAFVNVGGGAQSWVQSGADAPCMAPCSASRTPQVAVLSPIASLQAGFGASWIKRDAFDWYSNFSLGITYGNAFIVSSPVAAPTVRTVPDVAGSLLASTGVRITLWRDPRSAVRWSLLIDAAALGRTEPLAAGIFTIGTSVDIDRVVRVPEDGVRRLERD